MFLFAVGSSAATLHEQSLSKLKERLTYANPQDFTFVVLGDTRDNDEIFRKILALAQGFKPLFILHGGDLQQGGCQDELDHFLQVYREEAAELPIFVVPGNHERCRKEKKRGVAEGKGPFQRTIGPLNFVLDQAALGIKIIVLDNMDYGLTAEQLQSLRQELAAGRSLNFVAMHVPPQTKRWGKDHTFTRGAEEMLSIFREHKVAGAFFSHIHLFDEDRLEGARMFITGGGGAPLHPHFSFGKAAFHVLVVRVKDGTASMQPVWLPQ